MWEYDGKITYLEILVVGKVCGLLEVHREVRQKCLKGGWVTVMDIPVQSGCVYGCANVFEGAEI